MKHPSIRSDDQHLRLPEFEFFDAVRMTAASRWKDSDVSGSEWRCGFLLEFMYKGEVMATTGALNVGAAATLVAYHLLDNGVDLEVNIKLHAALTGTCCDQPGCFSPWTTLAWLRQRFTSDGELVTITPPRRFYRRFCDDHAHRGEEAGYEDCDANYVKERVR